MQTPSIYRAKARESLQGQWGDAALATLVYVVIALICCAPSIPAALDQSVFGMSMWMSNSLNGLGFVLSILLVWPLQYSLYNAFLALTRGSQASVWENTKSAFKRTYSVLLPAALLMYIIIVLLSVITLGIAGIIFAYAYRMTPYVINDYPNLSAKEALKISREMMKGHKWDLFVLDISFIGWWLLAIMTMGVGCLWLTPYQCTAAAHFYEDLKAEKIVDTDTPESETIEEVEAEEV